MCEPQVFGLWAGSSLAKMPSDGRAGGPRLGLDTSLIGTISTWGTILNFDFPFPLALFNWLQKIYSLFHSGCEWWLILRYKLMKKNSENLLSNSFVMCRSFENILLNNFQVIFFERMTKNYFKVNILSKLC